MRKNIVAREEIFDGGMSESICVLMDVDLSLRLIVMLCRFCKTLPKRSESVSPFPRRPARRRYFRRYSSRLWPLVAVVAYQLGEILKSQKHGHLVASRRRNQVVQALEIDGRQLVDDNRGFEFPLFTENSLCRGSL